MTDMTTLVATTAADKITAANAIAERVSASRVNVNKMFHDWRDGDDVTDENATKFRAFREQVLAKLEQAENSLRTYYIENVSATSAMSDEDFEAAKTEHAALRAEINATVKFLEMQPGGKDAAAALPDVLGLSGRKGGGTGTSGPRPRLAHATVNGADVYKDVKNAKGEEVRSVTFTLLAQHITKDAGEKVTPRMLQEAAFEQAGTTDLSTVAEVEFGYSVNGKNYTVAVFPRGAEDDTDNGGEDGDNAGEDDGTE